MNARGAARRGRGSPARFVVFPDLAIQRSAGRVVVTNLAHATHLETSEAILPLLELFARPRTLASLKAEFRLPPGTFEELRRHAILVPESELPLVRGGLLAPSRSPIGESRALPDLPQRAGRERGFCVVGVPLDRSTASCGARFGPAAVRGAFSLELDAPAVVDLDFRRRHDTSRLRVFDLGDLQMQPSETVETIGRRARMVIERALDAGWVPIVLGGDHSVAWFALEALLDRLPALGVLHFDAHHDLYAGPPGELAHSNPFAFALERRSLRVLHQIGLRTVEDQPVGTRPARDRRVRWVSSRELARMRPADVFRGLPTTIPYYLSFDIDCMDPSVAPETGTRVPGGLTYATAIELVDHAARRFRIVGADFVEVTRTDGRDNLAASIVARLLAQLVLSAAPHTRLTSYHFVYER
ncbi:MAG: arginase family protein [Deltaproteobacteria bacterium]|nr:arginase family protein [Deltaproteobacteria bacterium]